MPYLTEANEGLALTVHGACATLIPFDVILWLHGPHPAPSTELSFRPHTRTEPEADDGTILVDVDLVVVDAALERASEPARATFELGTVPDLADFAPLAPLFDGSVLLLVEFFTIAMTGRTPTIR